MYIEKISIHELLQVLIVKDEVMNIHNFSLLTKSYLEKFRHFYRLNKIVYNYSSGYKHVSRKDKPINCNSYSANKTSAKCIHSIIPVY